MSRIWWMVLRVYLPVGALLAFSVAVAMASSIASASPILFRVGQLLDKGVLLLLAASAMAWLILTYRLRRWEMGHGPDCRTCGGLLGIAREGRFGPYRKCLMCGKNCSCVSH